MTVRVRVAEHCNRIMRNAAARIAIVVGGEETAVDRTEAQDAPIVRRDEVGADVVDCERLWSGANGDARGRLAGSGENIGKDLLASAQVAVHGKSKEGGVGSLARIQNHQLMRVL